MSMRRRDREVTDPDELKYILVGFDEVTHRLCRLYKK